MMAPQRTRDVVLVVDDSPETLSMVTDALEETGATVLVAQGGESALTLVGRITPDVVLMDCIMPGLDGFETCQRMKTNPSLQHVPVIFMTGLSETDNIIKGLNAGGVDYLTKPIVPEELIARMTVHIANARHAQSAHIALDRARRHLVAADGDGRIVWCTPQATSLMERVGGRFDGTREDHLPAQLVDWLTKCRTGAKDAGDLSLLEDEETRLVASYLGQSGPDEYLFRVIEINEKKNVELLMGSFELTQREAEVLLWVAHGKSNKDIADIIAISPRTVNKHL